MSMSMAQALKTKKRLAARLAQIRDDVQTGNSYPKANVQDVDVRVLLVEEQAIVEKLVELRVAMAHANCGLWENLFLQAELKGRITFLKGISTQTGVVTDRGRYFSADNNIEYACQITKSEVDALLASLSQKLAKLVDQADCINATIKVDVDVPESMLYGTEA